MQNTTRGINNFTKPNLYTNVLAKLRMDARRHLAFTVIKQPTSLLFKLQPVIYKLQASGLILGISKRFTLQKTTHLWLTHACADGRPIRRAELVMRSNIKYNRLISFKQIRRLLIWGHGSDLLIATSHGVVTADYCIDHKLGGRILGSVRG